jgi:hypothetical protein
VALPWLTPVLELGQQLGDQRLGASRLDRRGDPVDRQDAVDHRPLPALGRQRFEVAVAGERHP